MESMLTVKTVNDDDATAVTGVTVVEGEGGKCTPSSSMWMNSLTCLTSFLSCTGTMNDNTSSSAVAKTCCSCSGFCTAGCREHDPTNTNSTVPNGTPPQHQQEGIQESTQQQQQPEPIITRQAPPPPPPQQQITNHQPPPPPSLKSNNNDQQQHLRERIEMDILALMGCTADSAEFCMTNLGGSLFCNNPNDDDDWYEDDEDDATIASSTCGSLTGGYYLGRTRRRRAKGSKNTKPTTRLRNRNVFVREKAMRRIKRLRKGGLSRTFSLAPVSAFLEEEMTSISSTRGRGVVPSSRRSRGLVSRHSVPNLLDEAYATPITPTTTPTKTSFLRKLDQQYPIQFTQSAEYETLQKSAREKTYKSNDHTHHHYKRKTSTANHPTTDDNSDNHHSTMSTSLLPLPHQFEESIGLLRVPSAASLNVVKEGDIELYYDSDPGCPIQDDLDSRSLTTTIPIIPPPAHTPTRQVTTSTESVIMSNPITPEHGPRWTTPVMLTPKSSPSSKKSMHTALTPKKLRKSSHNGIVVTPEKESRKKFSPLLGKKHRKRSKALDAKNDVAAMLDEEEEGDADSEEEGYMDGEGSGDSDDGSDVDGMNTSLLYTVDVNTFDVNNGLLVTQFIEELTNGFISLIWHPGRKQSAQSFTNPTPLHAQAWFEMGTCLKSTLVQPKFMWRGAYHRPNDDDSSNSNRNIQGPAFQTPHFVELLNIVRVIAPKSLDRNIHPFCRLTHAFTVSTSQDESYLFEAATEEERNRFVLGLKLVVARLASKIIVGDKGVFNDFFTPCGSRYSNRGKGSSKQSTPTAAVTIRKEEKPQVITSGVNFISESVNGEGKRTDELWGDA